jgi:hypothetical protein
MKMKSIIITALVIGVFFTGQAFAAHKFTEVLITCHSAIY